MPNWLILLLASLALVVIGELATKKLEALLLRSEQPEDSATSSSPPGPSPRSAADEQGG